MAETPNTEKNFMERITDLANLPIIGTGKQEIDNAVLDIDSMAVLETAKQYNISSKIDPVKERESYIRNLKEQLLQHPEAAQFYADKRTSGITHYFTALIARGVDQYGKTTVGKAGPDALKKYIENNPELAKELGKGLTDVFKNGATTQQKRYDEAFARWVADFMDGRRKAIESATAQAISPHEAITDMANLGIKFGALLSMAGTLFGKDDWVEMGQNFVTKGFNLAKFHANETMKLKELAENYDRMGPKDFATYLNQYKMDYTPEAVGIHRGAAKHLNSAEAAVQYILDDPARALGGDRSVAPLPAPGTFSVPGTGAAGGTVKDHKADTVRPYSSADVRKHAAAALAPSKWDPTIMAAAEKISAETGVPAAILAMEAKIRIGPESGGNPNAWNGGKGAKGEDAYGLMQLTPDTAKRYGVKDIKNPQQNIEGAMRFIGDIVSKYGRDNVDLYYYGGEGTKDHGPNTRQYVENLAAVRALLPKEGIVLASAKVEATKPPKEQKKVAAIDIRPDIKPNIKPDFKEVAGLTDQIQGADTRGLKTDAGALLARQEENQQVGDPKKLAKNDHVYILASNGPTGGLS